jgi:Flp pilus assembly protein TadD
MTTMQPGAHLTTIRTHGFVGKCRRGTITLSLLGALVLAGCATGGAGQPSSALGSPDERVMLEQQAAAALRSGRVDQARNIYRGLLQRTPGDASLSAALAEAERLLGNDEAALNHAQAAIDSGETKPTVTAQALFTSAAVLLVQGRDEAAEERLQHAVELDPNNWRAWNALGQARDRRQAWGMAEKAYAAALQHAPKEPAVLNNYGMSQLAAGNYAQAEQLFAKALERAPDLDIVDTNLRLALALQGRYEAALAATATGTTPGSLNNVGYAALMRGDYPSARAFFLQAIDASPSFYEPAWSNLRYLGTLEGRQAVAGESRS